ncbi:hypothetical protein ACSSZE_18550 [Acidithiobacillus caldus]
MAWGKMQANQVAKCLISVRSLLEDETATVRTTDGNEVDVAFEDLLDALEDRLEAILGVADGFDADADEEAPPPGVAHVSPRNADPEYRKAREALRREQAEAAAKTVDKSQPVVPFPVEHRDFLPPEERIVEMAINIANEEYLGKKITFYPIHVPFGEDNPEVLKEIITLTIILHSPVRIDSDARSRLDSMRVDGVEVREILSDIFNGFPPELQNEVRAGRFIERIDNNEWDVYTPFPKPSGKGTLLLYLLPEMPPIVLTVGEVDPEVE